MPEALLEFFTNHPYVGVTVVFLICGLGFPLPEEIVLVVAGYVTFKGYAEVVPMIIACSAAILAGDLVPYLLGRIFGSRLLRVRPLRMLVTKRRLSMFDRWFRRRGDLVIFFARFVTGLRIAAYFTAGTMKMPLRRFVILDLIGIALVAPTLVIVGYSFGGYIDQAIEKVQQVERGILIAALATGAVVGVWYLIRRRRQRQLAAGPKETFVGPSIDPQHPAPAEHPAESESESESDAATAAERSEETHGAETDGEAPDPAPEERPEAPDRPTSSG